MGVCFGSARADERGTAELNKLGSQQQSVPQQQQQQQTQDQPQQKQTKPPQYLHQQSPHHQQQQQQHQQAHHISQPQYDYQQQSQYGWSPGQSNQQNQSGFQTQGIETQIENDKQMMTTRAEIAAGVVGGIALGGISVAMIDEEKIGNDFEAEMREGEGLGNTCIDDINDEIDGFPDIADAEDDEDNAVDDIQDTCADFDDAFDDDF